MEHKDTTNERIESTNLIPDGPRRGHRWRGLGAGLAVLGVLAVGAGTAYAVADDGTAPVPSGGSMAEQMDRMHRSDAARDMHAQMPPELRARMDAMHEQMVPLMGEMETMMGTGTDMNEMRCGQSGSLDESGSDSGR